VPRAAAAVEPVMQNARQTNDKDNSRLTLRQCREQRPIQLFAFVVAAGASAFIGIWFASARLERPGDGPEVVLRSTINPNTAPAASLARLPGIGPTRAAAIVDYRQSFSADEGAAGAFKDCADLQKVKGIGPKTAGGIRQFLRFD